MKHINNYITEKLKINKNKLKKGTELTLFPKDNWELANMIDLEIKNKGNKCSLNHIDVSSLTDLSFVFARSTFNGDISDWDVSSVTNMSGIFANSVFNNNSICLWDVSNVENMSEMFYHSKFNKDISGWDVSNVKDMDRMFDESKFNRDISDWDVSNVENMNAMFSNSIFKQDISNWKINNKCITCHIFYNCPIKDEYKPDIFRN